MRDKESIQETTGSNKNVAQSFFQNILYSPKIGVTSPFAFDVPMYTTNGGSKDYYGQEPESVFTNIAKPFIKFDFIKNTGSFGPKVKIKHDVYRVSWDLFNAVQTGYKPDLNESTESNDETIETIEEIDELTGVSKKKTIVKNLRRVRNLVGSHKKVINSDVNVNKLETEIPTPLDIQAQFDEPIYSITANTGDFSSNTHYLEISQFIKNLGKHKTELFKDRDQYVIDTNFIFEIDVTSGLTDYKTIVGDEIVNSEYVNPFTAETKSYEHVIEKGPFEGVRIKGGNYFTYFEVPDKPTFEYPTPEGKLDTFTPEIFWTNGEGADEYVVQVTYNTADTSFSGTVYSYIVPKSDDYKETAENRNKMPSTEFSSEKTIRKYQLSLKTNKALLYRVGNVKYIRNLFDVKQSVVTFSDNKMIYTQSRPMNTLVMTESDSPWTNKIVDYRFPPSLEILTVDTKRTLSGIVNGVPSGATPSVSLSFPEGISISKPTEPGGAYSFSGITNESYFTLTTSYRGYKTSTINSYIESDLTLDVNLELLWGNNKETWHDLRNMKFKY